MYLAGQLNSTESIIYSSTWSSRSQGLDLFILSFWVFVLSLFWNSIMLVYIPLFVFILFGQWLHRRFTEYVVTNQRIIFKTGIISINTLEIPLSRIESIVLNQTFTQRLCGFGSVVFTGVGRQRTVLGPVNDPQALRQAVSNQI